MRGVAADGPRRDPPSNDGEDSPLEAIAAGTVATITLGVAFGLLALGQSYFWVAFPVGFGGGMPLAVALARWYGSHAETDESTRQRRTEADAALADLRDRYARGELDEEEFEARLERLLETESVADARSSVQHETTLSEDSGSRSERDPANVAEQDR
jgi:Predicted membrane protein